MGDNKRSAQAEAARFLAVRLRTEAEVREHLLKKDYPEDEIRQSVADLISLRYIDDYAYALAYYEYGFAKQRGRMRIKRELASKGVSACDIDNAYQDYLAEHKVDEYGIALEIARGVMRDEGYKVPDEKQKAKLARKLQGRGYSTDIIIRVLANVAPSDNQVD